MSWLARLFGRPDRLAREDFVRSVSIDTSGPEFADIYPPREAIEEAISSTGRFRPADVEWMTDIAAARICSGMNFRGPVQEIVRTGDLLQPATLKAKGLNSRRKIGTRFAEAITAGGIEDAVEALDTALHTETSRALQLHNLRRMQRLGIEFCKFVSPGEGASLPLEAELNGKRLSVDEAINLVKSRAGDIRRSIFAAEVHFPGGRPNG